jgi:large repetitive protein
VRCDKARRMRTHRVLAPLSVVLVATLANCAATDAPPPETKRATERGDGSAAVGRRDPRLGAPSFVWFDQSVTPEATHVEAAKATLGDIARAWRMTPDAAKTLSTPQIHDVGVGPVIARFQQRVRGLDVFRGGVSVLMTRDRVPVSGAGLLATSLRGSDQPFVKTEAEALRSALATLEKLDPERTVHAPWMRRLRASSLPTPSDAGPYHAYALPELYAPARVKPVLFPVRNDDAVELVPAHYVDVLTKSGPSRSFVFSAVDGRLLFSNDLRRADAFTYRAYVNDDLFPMDGPHGDTSTPHPTGTPDRRALTFIPGRVVSLQNYPFSRNDPWLAADATSTFGNNVIAYSDRGDPDGFTNADVQPPLSGPLAFDYSYDTAQSPGAVPTSIYASTVHLFYVTNFLHDWFYDAGFDEASGNHQRSNFGRGGVGGDPLRAEAQDYSGRNNADATTPPDGTSPRIQMYVFSGPTTASIDVLTPPGIAGAKPVGTAGEFGKDVFDISGTVVLADDGNGDVADACQPINPSAAGKIVLVHRGSCSFVQKSQAVQDAGGIAIIIANVASSASPNTPPYMGGTAADVRIPVLSLSLGDGQALEGAIAGGATVRMKRDTQIDLDGALDTTIVAHEWGHVISNRLVADGNGLTTNQAGGLGEGWGDFLALITTVRAEDVSAVAGRDWAGAYANGGYATSGGGADIYFGTRRVPYSIDFSKNALTFKHIQNGVPLPPNVPTSFGEDGSFNAEVHATGEVWATMLWECFAALLRDGRYSFQEARDHMRRYLVASLKITPPDPTLLEARDALLAAALATDRADFLAFFKAFARRGAGVGAKGPPKDSADNGGVVESTLVGSDVEVLSAVVTDDVISCDNDGILDEGEEGTVEITVRNAGTDILPSTTVQLATTTPGVTLVDTGTVKVRPLVPFDSAKVKVRASISAGARGAPIELDVQVTDPTLVDKRIVHFSLPTRYDADELPQSATKDTVDTKSTAWVVTGEDVSGGSAKWARVRKDQQAWWGIPNATEPSDHQLTSPPFTIAGTTCAISFRHRYSFAESRRTGRALDGGVVEVSIDSGKTWLDVEAYGAKGYNTQIDPNRRDNPLAGRPAFAADSVGYPEKWLDAKFELTFPAAPPSVMVRFRAGTGYSFGAPGWEIDDIEIGGATSKPFFSYQPHADQCDPGGPKVDAGPTVRAASGSIATLEGSATHPRDLPLTFLWSQIAGPPVELRDTATATPSFIAPPVQEPVTYTFKVRAHDGKLLSAAAQTDVIVEPSLTTLTPGGSGCACRTTAPRRDEVGGAGLFALAAGALVRRRRRAR